MTASRPAHLRRLAVVTLLAFVVSAGAAGARTERATSLHFTALPHRLVQADRITVAVSVHPSNVLCTLSLRYADGRVQGGGTVMARSGKAKWRFRLMGDAAPGHAGVTANCGRAGTVQRTVLVVGSVIPARIVVVKDGFSIRQQQFASPVSYGVILRNTSPTQDALQVYCLVNFVGPDNRLVGSATTTVPGIPAGEQFALGGDLTFPGGVPDISRLEIVVQIQKRQAHALKLPTITSLSLAPSVFEPDWLGAVQGEVSNDKSGLELQNAQLSAVIFNGTGDVIGGGSGFASASLPPSAREFFKIENGFRAIPFGEAAGAMVSAVGTYVAP